MACQRKVLRTTEEAIPSRLERQQSLHKALYGIPQYVTSWHSRRIGTINEARVRQDQLSCQNWGM